MDLHSLITEVYEVGLMILCVLVPGDTLNS